MRRATHFVSLIFAVLVGATAHAADVIQLAPPDIAAGDKFGQAVAADDGAVVVGAPFHDQDATDAGSAYVFVARGIFLPLQTELRPSDPEASAHFGAAVAVSADTVAVGAPDDGGTGAVYVFERTAGAWAQVAKLTSGTSGDAFGASVAIDGGTIVVGAPGRSSSAGAVFVFVKGGASWTQQAEIAGAGGAFGTSVGVRGNRFVGGAPLASSSRGLAKVYLRSGTTWTLEASLDPTDAADGDETGGAVAIGDAWIAVGAAKADATGAADAGAVHVYGQVGGTWTRSARLVAPTPSAGAAFGSAVALDDDVLAVGSPLRDVGITDAGGVDLFVVGADGFAFSAAVFVPGAAASDRHGASVALAAGRVVSGTPDRGDGAAFAQWDDGELKLTATDGAANDYFGWSVDVSGDTALVGAYGDEDGGTDAGSVYVFVRSGAAWIEQQKLTASDAAANDWFGFSVALSGDTALVGAYGDDDRGVDAGAAYVFVRTDGTWTQSQKLTSSDGAAGDWLGRHVAIDGDTALVSSQRDDDIGADSGSAYVFARSGSTWAEQAKLLPSDGAAGDSFGRGVALQGNTAMVGAPVDSPAGSVYVFARSGTSWTQQQKLTQSDGAAGDLFGSFIAIEGDTALISAHAADDAGTSSGSVYAFTRSGTTWSQQQKLTASDAAAGDLFGWKVALSADTAVIGAYGADDVGTDSGAAYVFVREAGAWVQREKLTAFDGAAGDQFGYSVALSGDTALIGATGDDDRGADAGAVWIRRLDVSVIDQTAKVTASDASEFDVFGWSVALSGDTALVGAPSDGDNSTDPGAAYVFVRSEDGWTQQTKLALPAGGPFDYFGRSVALSGDTALVAATHDDSARGAVYVFVRSGDGWTRVQKLTASDGAEGELFGVSMALSGDTALVGAGRGDDGVGTGAVYVFVRSDGVWTEQQKLEAADGQAGDFFGCSVALSADTAVVGMIAETYSGAGAAYVFVRSAGVWTQQQKLTASGGKTDDYFGISVALFGDTALVAAHWDDENGAGSGAVYSFARAGGVWTQQQKLTASDGATEDTFGAPVALFGDTAVIGATGDDDGGDYSGSAYVFVLSDGVWTQRQKLTASDRATGDMFGAFLALSGDTALVAAPYDDDGGMQSGSIYFFDLYGPQRAPFTARLGDLPAHWTVGRPLGATGSASGGTAPYQWRVATGSLPDGLSLDARTGSISGAPTAAGTFSYTLEACDAWGTSTSTNDAITVNPAPVVPAATLAPWTVTRPYSAAIVETGGTSPLTWDLASGATPPGTSLTAAGSLTGTPTATASYVFSARVTDAVGATATGTISVTINPRPVITTPDLPSWTERRPYLQTLESSGGTAPFTWSATSGEFPVDTALGSATGRIEGTALAAGSYTFTAQVLDAAGATAARTFTVTVNAWPELMSTRLALGAQGRPYDVGPDVVGGTPAFQWAITAGDVPAGLALDPATGRLPGAPTIVGDANLDFQVTDAAGAVATRTCALVVVPRCGLAKSKLVEKHDVAAGQGGADIVRFVELLGGTDVDLTMTLKTKTTAAVELLLLDAAEQPMDLSPYMRTKKKLVTVRNFPVPETGRYFVVVRPDAGFEGRVTLTVAASADKTWKGKATLDPAGQPISFDFCALPGSKLVVTTRASRKSAAVPTIGGLADADGVDLLVPAELKEAKKSATLRAKTPLAGGDYRVTISPRGDAVGDVEWTVQLRSPKGYVFELPDVPVGGSGE